MVTVSIMDFVSNKKPQIGPAESAKLFAFCMERSSQILFARYHEEEIPKEVFDQVIARGIKDAEDTRERQLAYLQTQKDRQILKDLGCSRQSAVQTIHDGTEDTIERLKNEDFSRFSGKDTVEEDLKPFGLLKREITNQSPTTFGPWFDLCWFPKDALDLSPIAENLFFEPIKLGDYELFDPCFVNEDGEVWACICSHEGTFDAELPDEDYPAFAALDIDHDSNPPKKKKRVTKKTLIVGAISAATVLGAAFGITLSVKKKGKKDGKA